MNKNKKFLIDIAAKNCKLEIPVPVTQRFPCDETKLLRCPCNDDTKLLFYSGTTCECAEYVIESGLSNEHVYAHSYASAINPGGGVNNGAKAQEEFNCYRIPGLYRSIAKEKYPLEPGTVLVTPGLKIMRNCVDYELLPDDQMVNIGIVSAAAQNLSRIYGKECEKYDDQLTRKTLANLFCSVKRCDPLADTLVLGAWGCGVFKNDPYAIANATKDVINKYGGYYKNIIIAIPGSDKDPNVKAFKHVFGFDTDEEGPGSSPESSPGEEVMESVEKSRKNRKANRKKINAEKHSYFDAD